MIFQERFDRLEAGEGHSDIDGVTSPGRVPPEVQLGRTEAGAGLEAWVLGAEAAGGTLGTGHRPVWSGSGQNGKALGSKADRAQSLRRA